MGWLNNSRIISGFANWSNSSRIINATRQSAKGSIIYKVLTRDKKVNRVQVDDSFVLKGFVDEQQISKLKNIEKKPGKTGFLGMIESSFFINMIITWKDCEDDDKFN